MTTDSLLPKSMQDSNNLALEECIKEAVNVDVKKLMVYPIENANENLLPILAKEFHVLGAEGWNIVSTKKEKQNLIINSIAKHAKKGCINSITEALNTIDIEASILEFWQYAGRPAHFMVEFLNIYDRNFTSELEEMLEKMIKAYKPASRILDKINYFLCSKGLLYASSSIRSTEKTILATKEVIL
ncbi:MAG: phage tail protein I [Candidatus Gastranaerophilales bacterium]|nr:phage tail protein I [Candidatus Gastranaerophilales bacterium]